MKKSVIMIGVLGLFLELAARDYSQAAPTRAQMLLEAKQLFQRYDMLKNKKQAWQKRQIVILDDFNKIYETDEHFGDSNRYGKKRLEKRQNDFYTSLQEKNDEIENKLFDAKRKLASIKKDFSRLYSVPLTLAEAKGGSAPKIADRKNKIRLLEEYLSSKDSWRACLEKNKSFDVKRVDIENIAHVNVRRYEYKSGKLEKEVESNLLAQRKYEKISKNARLEYRKKYGYTLKSVKTAKRLLANIKD